MFENLEIENFENKKIVREINEIMFNCNAEWDDKYYSFLKVNNNNLLRALINKENALKSYVNLGELNKECNKLYEKDKIEFIKVFELCKKYIKRHYSEIFI